MEPGSNRDDFPSGVKDLLAARVAHRCSNLECRAPTSGPQDTSTGKVNLGVAAHISAASPGGPRYDKALTAEQRRDSASGIWLCQTCAKLIDSDPVRYPTGILLDWKADAETLARAELQRRPLSSVSASDTAARLRLERLVGPLLDEMRADLRSDPVLREFILMRRGWSYGGGDHLAYYYDDHPRLDSLVQILQNYGLIYEISTGTIRRFVFTEPLVEYLESSSGETA